MFNLKEFIVKNIVNGIKNGTFSKEYGNIMAVNYLVKGILTEEDVASIDAQIIAWEEEKTSTNVYGDELKLSDYLQIGAYIQDEYVSGANYADLLMPTMFGTREAAISHISNFTKVTDVNYGNDKVLLPGNETAQVAAIVVNAGILTL